MRQTDNGERKQHRVQRARRACGDPPTIVGRLDRLCRGRGHPD
jgi:hypothetical protein